MIDRIVVCRPEVEQAINHACGRDKRLVSGFWFMVPGFWLKNRKAGTETKNFKDFRQD